ncbi:hypothetical protein HPB49_010627 [Dermacentor silvarum]|uniref:Uncharacterized protein n=1 Tax=Dermacentor silvarum TaxID=543639 RepID=A0ACB8D4S1_DERSI|nr:hypothetical protein HPB49_010627 [Dermacentor silvarum]
MATGEGNLVVTSDLKSAFDTMSHKLIMEEIEKMGCGKKTFDYVKSFLTARTATTGLEDIRSPKLNLPNKGTPQGAILSPLLFNIDTNNLARRLHQIQDLKFALYVDDITLWMHKGSLGHKAPCKKPSTLSNTSWRNTAWPVQQKCPNGSESMDKTTITGQTCSSN